MPSAGGEFLTLLGPSGSGKTTVLRLIGGFTEASSGQILFDGQDITQLPANRRPFNTVFQDYALFPHMTVLQNAGYGPLVQRRTGDDTRKLIDETLDIVGLSALRDRYPAQLSGGQKQRVALARAIICQPKVILLDEPLAALDATLRRQMQVFLKQIQRRIDTTFVFVTHDQDEAITMSDRIVVMNLGRIEQVGRRRDLYFSPRTRFVAGFFGDNNLISGTVSDADACRTRRWARSACLQNSLASSEVKRFWLASGRSRFEARQGPISIPADRHRQHVWWRAHEASASSHAATRR